MLRPRYSQADQKVELSRAFVDQVAKQVARVLLEVPHPGFDSRGKGTQGGGGSPVMIAYNAIVTSAISQASGTTFGTGQVQLYYADDQSSSALTQDTDNAAVPVQNWYTTSGTIATGKHCVVISISGALWLLTWEC
jgi:hypothetical protein